MKLFLAYLLVWLGGAALLFWALAACFGCDAPSIEGHDQHVFGTRLVFGGYLFAWVIGGFFVGIMLLIRLAVWAWEVRFAADP
jgi:hypothetical protein